MAFVLRHVSQAPPNPKPVGLPVMSGMFRYSAASVELRISSMSDST